MSHYTFKEPCISCGGVPSYNGHLMCDPCCVGEASTLWDWLDTEWIGEERKLAQEYIMSILEMEELVKEDFTLDPIMAAVLHIDQSVLDRIENIMD